eukprot:XP_011675846.1 PREDICTED: tolloid-like protein 2 [Strongylocentrotus purpuratus]
MAFLFIALVVIALIQSLDSAPIRENIVLISGTVETIQSLNYPSNYNNYLDYTWNISAPDDHSITVIFRDFDLEEDYDFLSLEYNPSARTGDDILLANLTGSTYPTNLTSPVNNLWIRFTSDYTINATGFSLEIKAIPQTACVFVIALSV